MQRQRQSDAELISAVRSGDTGAFDTLYSRHRTPARTFARMLTASSSIDAEDIVADAFLKVLSALTKGRGPAEAFRPYLLATIRSTFVDESRYRSKVRATEDLEDCLPAFRGTDPAAREDQSYAAAAFTSLPERWQAVLWHLDVEGEPPRKIAAMLGVSAAAVSSLAIRAREGLRRGYLQAHLRHDPAHRVECDFVLGRLAGWTRNPSASRSEDRIGRHLITCSDCRSVAADLREVNSSIGAIVAPALLGAAAMSYLTARTALAHSVGVTVQGSAWLALTKAKVAGSAVAGLTALSCLCGTPATTSSMTMSPDAQAASPSTGQTGVAPPRTELIAAGRTPRWRTRSRSGGSQHTPAGLDHAGSWTPRRPGGTQVWAAAKVPTRSRSNLAPAKRALSGPALSELALSDGSAARSAASELAWGGPVSACAESARAWSGWARHHWQHAASGPHTGRGFWAGGHWTHPGTRHGHWRQAWLRPSVDGWRPCLAPALGRVPTRWRLAAADPVYGRALSDRPARGGSPLDQPTGDQSSVDQPVSECGSANTARSEQPRSARSGRWWETADSLGDLKHMVSTL